MSKYGSSDQAVKGKTKSRTGLSRTVLHVLTALALLATIATPVVLAKISEAIGQDPAAEEQVPPESQFFATDPFDLEQGLAIVKMTHQGEGSFVVNLLPAEQGENEPTPERLEFFGDREDGGRAGAALPLADNSGSVDVSRAVPIPISGKHLFDVKADGPWTIQVEQSSPSEAPRPTRFSGDDDSATPFFRLSSGPKTIDVTNPVGVEFAVLLRDANGNETARILGDKTDQTEQEAQSDQEDQTSTVSSRVEIPEDGIYVFDVRADNLWTVEISDAG